MNDRIEQNNEFNPHIPNCLYGWEVRDCKGCPYLGNSQCVAERKNNSTKEVKEEVKETKVCEKATKYYWCCDTPDDLPPVVKAQISDDLKIYGVAYLIKLTEDDLTTFRLIEPKELIIIHAKEHIGAKHEKFLEDPPIKGCMDLIKKTISEEPPLTYLEKLVLQVNENLKLYVDASLPFMWIDLTKRKCHNTKIIDCKGCFVFINNRCLCEQTTGTATAASE